MHFDDLLKQLGEFGRYQKLQFFLLCLVSIVSGWHGLNMVFVIAKPDYFCNIPNQTDLGLKLGNISDADVLSLMRYDDEKCEIANSTEAILMVAEFGYNYTTLMRNKTDLGTVKCENGWEYSKEKYTNTIVSEFNLVCDNNWLTSTAKSVFFVGRLLGAIVFGQLSDKYGRRPCFFVGIGLKILSGCLAAVSVNISMFLVFYLLQGLAQVGTFLVAFTAGMELVGPRYRLMASFVIHIFYSIGYMTLAGLGYGIRNWRYLNIAITLPTLLFGLYWWVVPESVRWLLTQNRNKEAKVIINKAAKMNHVELEDDVIDKLDANAPGPKFDKTYTFVDLVKTWPIARLSLNIWFNWFVNAFVYYGLSLNTSNLGGNPYLNFCIAGAVEIPACILCILILDRVGRRKPLFAFMVVGGACCIASPLVPRNIKWLAITLAMTGKLCITASYGIIYLMTAETFPTVVRSIGMGMSSMSARIGGIIAPYVLDLQDFAGPLPLIIFGVFSGVAGGLALLLPEPLGKPLPQTLDDISILGRKKDSKPEEDLREMGDNHDKKTDEIC